jgi:hypothetical protein
VLLNLGIIVLVMLPSFRDQVLPTLPSTLIKLSYLLATVHAMLGTVAEIAGLFVLLSAVPSSCLRGSESTITICGCAAPWRAVVAFPPSGERDIRHLVRSVSVSEVRAGVSKLRATGAFGWRRD